MREGAATELGGSVTTPCLESFEAAKTVDRIYGKLLTGF